MPFFFASLAFSQTSDTIASFGITIRSNLVFIDTIYINDIISNNFIIDTGSSGAVLDSDFAAKLKLNEDYDYAQARDIEDNIEMLQKTHISSLKINNIYSENMPAVIIDLKQENEQIDGYIGADFFKNKIWSFDLPNKKVHCLKQVDADRYKYRIPVKLEQGRPLIKIKIKNKTFNNILIDMGNVNRFLFAEKDTALLYGKSDFDNYYQVSSTSLFRKDEKIKRVKESFFNIVEIGNLKVDSCTAVFSTNRRCIGVPFLQNSSFAIDFKRKKLYANDFKQKIEPFFGCRFKINEHGKIIIISIQENSLAVKKGLQLGDEVIVFNDIENSSLKEIIRNGSIYKKLDENIVVKRTSSTTVALVSPIQPNM